MIDNEETGQVEELDDIVVDLAEDEGKQPEETSDTESPITEEVEEEKPKKKTFTSRDELIKRRYRKGVVETSLGRVFEIKSIEDFFLMTLTGILGGTAAILFIYSYRLISASKMASFEYLGIPSSFVLGWIFFKEAPCEQLFPGVIAIVLAGMIIIWRDKVKQKSIKGNNQFN